MYLRDQSAPQVVPDSQAEPGDTRHEGRDLTPHPPGGRETGWVRVASVLGFQEPASVNYERKRQREGRPA